MASRRTGSLHHPRRLFQPRTHALPRLSPSSFIHKLLPLTLLLAALAPSLPSQSFDLQKNPQPVVSLDGLWHFHTGDNPAWASPTFDDSQWPLLRSTESWSTQGYPGLAGFAWYRFKLQVPDGSKPLSLLLQPILTSYRVYADGRLIGAFGYLPPHDLALTYRPMAYGLPRSNQPGPRTIQIAIRVWHMPAWASYAPGGICLPGNIAGDSTLIHQRMLLINLFRPTQFANTYTYSILAALFGLLALGLFFLNRTDREYLWFALVLLASAANAANQISFSIPVQIFDLFDGCLLGLFSIAALLFFSRVLRTPRTFWWWFAVGAASLLPFQVFLYWSGLTSVPFAGTVNLLCSLPTQLWILAALVHSAVRKDADARLLLFPALLMFGYTVANNLRGLAYQFGWQRTSYAFDPVILHDPYPLYLSGVVSTIFAFFMMIFLIRRFSLARREEDRLSREFEAARTVQALLIPAHPPATPGFNVESVYLPATEVGGDFFHIQPAADGSLLIITGDVSGKGLKAAMTVSTIIGALRNDLDRAPAHILSHLNRILYGNITGFATCAAALIHHDGFMTIANAGHLSPYLNGHEVPIPGSLPLGLSPDAEFEQTTLTLQPGDRLTLITDGIVEAQDKNKNLFGFERTTALLQQNTSALQIADAIQTFGQEDDITVLSVTRTPTPQLHPAISPA